MNDILKTLTKIANECDSKGLTKEADEIDYLIVSLAQSLKPVGKPFTENGVEVQMYIDQRTGKSVKKPVDVPAPLEPKSKPLGQRMLEKGYEYLSDKAESGIKNLFDTGIDELGKATEQEEGAKDLSEWAGFKTNNAEDLTEED